MVGPEGCRITFLSGWLDIMCGDGLLQNPRSRDAVKGEGIPLETTAEILAKKLHLRVLEKGITLARDLYDFAVAKKLEPDALDAAWNAREILDLESTLFGLASFSDGWMARQESRVSEARVPQLEAQAVELMLEDVRTRLGTPSCDSGGVA